MPLTMLEAALWYAKHGWYVFPCNKEKEPYIKGGVLSASTNAKEIEAWWAKWPHANIGVDVGRSGFMVLDLDPGHDMAQLEAKIGKLHPTQLWQQTPRGGKHLFYRLDEGEIVPPSASKLAPHVDVRSFHSYVLVAPSATDAGEYVMHGTPARAAHRSDAMVEQARQAKQRDKNHDTWLIEPDLPENIESAVKWLKEDAKIAIQGQGGDHQAYATAAMCKSFGLAQETALELMWAHWSPRCNPPWAGEDDWEHLETKVRNAYEYNTSAPGNMTPAYREAVKAQKFKPVRSELVATGMEFTAGRFRGVDWLGMQSISPPEWIIDGLLPKDSYAMLFGAPGTFKTFVALDMALSIALGDLFLADSAPWARKIIASGPVLFTAGEGRSGIARRARAWVQTHAAGMSPDNFVLMDPVPLISEELEPFLNVAKSFHDQYALVVIDTIGRAMQGADENAQKEASKFTAMVETLRRELGASVLALHHTGHGDSSRERGSTVFGADADLRLRLDRVEKHYAVTLSVVKQKDAEEGNPTKIELRKVNTSLGGDSLVCVKPEATKYEPGRKPETEGKGKSKFDPTKHEDGEIFAKLDAAIKEEMTASPAAIWTQSQLAEILAKREDMQIGAKRIDDLLRILRVKHGTFAHSVYHPDEEAKHRWQCKSRPK